MKKLVTIIAIASAAALVYYCVRYIQSPVSTMAAYSVVHEQVINADAYIVRDETVYNAPTGGTFYSYTREGARVGKDRTLCTVYEGAVSEDILQELGTVNAKISELSTTVVDESVFMLDGGSTQSRLVQIESEIEKAAAQNDVAKISQYKKEINSIASGESVQSNSQTLEQLQAQKNEIESQITIPRHDIVSSVSGIYSVVVDGYEGILTPEAAKTMNVENFAKIAPQAETPTPEATPETEEQTSTQTVSGGDGVCKVIDNHEWFVMALVDREQLEGIEVGQTVGLRFGKLPGEETTAELISISNDPQGQTKAVLVFSCKSYLEGVFSIRTSDIEIITESYEGFSVPIHAIRVVDGQNGVMVNNSGREVFKPCEIIYTDEEKGTAIIQPDTDDQNKTLQELDMIIIGEK